MPELHPGDYYFENGLMVFTAAYHARRGTCCGNRCRHCPFEHVNVARDSPDEPSDVSPGERRAS